MMNRLVCLVFALLMASVSFAPINGYEAPQPDRLPTSRMKADAVKVQEQAAAATTAHKQSEAVQALTSPVEERRALAALNNTSASSPTDAPAFKVLMGLLAVLIGGGAVWMLKRHADKVVPRPETPRRVRW